MNSVHRGSRDLLSPRLQHHGGQACQAAFALPGALHEAGEACGQVQRVDPGGVRGEIEVLSRHNNQSIALSTSTSSSGNSAGRSLASRSRVTPLPRTSNSGRVTSLPPCSRFQQAHRTNTSSPDPLFSHFASSATLTRSFPLNGACALIASRILRRSGDVSKDGMFSFMTFTR